LCSGFTTAAAMTIGVSQIKNAFGFISSIPQAGQKLNGIYYEYNYQVFEWFTKHWNDHDIAFRSYRNPIAMRVSSSRKI
jgi:hypothetical protein